MRGVGEVARLRHTRHPERSEGPHVDHTQYKKIRATAVRSHTVSAVRDDTAKLIVEQIRAIFPRAPQRFFLPPLFDLAVISRE